MRGIWPRLLTGLTIAMLAATLVAPAVTIATGGGSSSGQVRTINKGTSSFPATGAFTPSGTNDVVTQEFAGEDEGDGADDSDVVNRSLSTGQGNAPTGPSTAPGGNSKSKFVNGFEGLNHYQQRYSRGGNQFSLEPPDQALCVGNGYVLEAVNDVLNIFNTAGVSQLPNNTATNIVAGFPRNVNHAIDLNSFYGYAPAINRSTGVRGPFVTDPSCIYDAQTQRFFVTVLTLETLPSGAFTGDNHIDIAVSATNNPTGSWNIYQMDVTADGTDTGGVNPGPYLGDYPHIGADANTFLITTNAYPWCCNGFSGAQIYALSKAQLAAGSGTVTVVHFDTSGMVNTPSEAGATQPGFTVWPAQSPDAASFNTSSGGTEYFLSSNAADEAQKPVTGTAGTRTSNQIIQWTLTNTSSINTAPALLLSNAIVPANQYGVPPKQTQPGSGSAPGKDVPQGYCINNTTTATIAGTGCWRLLFGAEPAHNEVVSRPDSNDTRMQQVMYANGKVWGALDTGLSFGNKARAGIAWYIVDPSTSTMAKQGYLGNGGWDLTYPAIGVNASGKGVIAITATSQGHAPSAAYADIDAVYGATHWNIIRGGDGAAPDDGFTSYKSQVGNPPRTRWGDYGAAAVDGNSIWLASEYIGHSCNYTNWGGPFFGGSGDNLLGTCGGAGHGPGGRTAFANWSTFVSQFKP